MKKRLRLILILTLFVLLAVGWTWRYVTLNRHYDDLDNSEYKRYKAGEMVPFEDDGNDFYTDLNGYYICVDDYEVRDYDAYAAGVGISLSKTEDNPDKVALVYITLKNENCEPNPVMLTDFSLHGVDTVIPVEWTLLVKSNPALNGNTGIALEPGMEFQLVLPYVLKKGQFEGSTWRRIEDYKVFLQVTSALTTKDIAVNG